MAPKSTKWRAVDAKWRNNQGRLRNKKLNKAQRKKIEKKQRRLARWKERKSWIFSTEANKQERKKCDPKKDAPVVARIGIYVLPPHVQKPHILDFIMTVSNRPPVDIYLHHRPGHYIMVSAIVSFDNQRDATICIRELDHKVIEGVRVRVYEAQHDFEELPKGDFRIVAKNELEYMAEYKKIARTQKNETSWIECSNLSRSVDEQAILDHIRLSGLLEQRPKDILLYQHPVHSDYPGFARIQCATPQDATTLVEGLHLSELHGQRMWMEWKRVDFEYHESARLKHRYQRLAGTTTTIELLNLDYTVDSDEILQRIVCQFGGEMVNSVIYRFANGFMQRRACVQMATTEQATAVWEQLHGKRVRGSEIHVDYRPEEYGEAQWVRKESLHRREMERRKRMKRMINHGDPRRGVDLQMDYTVGTMWRNPQPVGVRLIRKDQLPYIQKKMKVKLDVNTIVMTEGAGIIKSTRKYGTCYPHRQSELKGMKKKYCDYEISDRWGVKYLN